MILSRGELPRPCLEQTKRGKSSQVREARPSQSSSAQTAVYLADMCGELAAMAKAADLVLLAHLLTLAQAEAEGACEPSLKP